jgi:DNA primase
MTSAAAKWVDVVRIRHEHPIADVVSAAGVELTPRGRGFMGCCPFHEDHTASLSVDGVPGRFHCFGCGNSGDVIEFVRRLRGVSFREAIDHLENTAITPAPPIRPPVRAGSELSNTQLPMVDPDRGFEVNAFAWQHFSTPVATEFAHRYLRNRRGIDLHALRLESPEAPLVGSAGHGWTGLVDHLRARGVSDQEILAMDLGHRTRGGDVIDALRDRVIVPVTEPDGRIRGFIGRDTSGDPRTPKYRNPTRTATFDKSTVLYRPTHHEIASDGTAVVVEGVIDTLAIAAAAAHSGRTADFAPCTASGIAVSEPQAAMVVALAAGSVLLALDADQAGVDGTRRWLAALAFQHQRPAAIATLPDGLDPAEWLARTGHLGLLAFDASAAQPGISAPHQAGRELVQLSLTRAREPLQDTVAFLLPLAAQLRPADAAVFLNQAEDEMTRSGWNPQGSFSRALREHPLARPHNSVISVRRDRGFPECPVLELAPELTWP